MSSERPHGGMRKRLKQSFRNLFTGQPIVPQRSQRSTPDRNDIPSDAVSARQQSIETSPCVGTPGSRSEAGPSSLPNDDLLAVPAHCQTSTSTNPSPHECIIEEPLLAHNYGTVNNIASAANVLAGTNYGTVNMISENTDFLSHLHERLKISLKAEWMYYPSGDDEMALRRGCCTPGTRIRILQAIIRWAMETLPGSERVYWLSGQAGAGKSTVAYTICQYFESLVREENTQTILGGSFFCSRQFLDTRSASAIVRTITHQLAHKSKAFRNALKDYGRFETINHGPRSQLMGLLVEPWRESAPERLADNEPCYVIPIDAVDELEGTGGQEFLSTLFDVVDREDLAGLKFLITSRPDPTLVQRIESFSNKQVCRLEEVPIAESNADIKLFLDETLSQCATELQKEQLVSEAAGLFIHAATVVEYVKGRDLDEQRTLLKRLLAPPSPSHRPSRGATATLDKLYTQILETSLVDPRDRDDPDVFQDCLSILHTFLCAIERTSTSVAVGILNETQDEGKGELDAGAAKGILHRLHAVLYSRGGRILWFHKSFPDFIFSKPRSQKFFCDQDRHHRRLVTGCFEVMTKQLRFNIANIPSSYQLDRDNATLASSINSNISSVLRYACGNWAGHLTLTPSEQGDSLLVTLHSFLQLRILFWIEVMNLVGYRGRCQDMMRSAQNWVVKAKVLVGWAKELADAAAFAVYHNTSKAVWSTPHLYISSLATFPRQSALLQQWRQHFEGIPGFVNAPGAHALLSSFEVGDIVKAVAVAPDGIIIAIGTFSTNCVHILDLSTGEIVMTFEGHTSAVNSVAFSPDGTLVISGSDDKSFRVWDLSSGEEVKAFQGHTDEVTSVAFSPNGNQVVSGSRDRYVRVWDLPTGDEVGAFYGHTQLVLSVAFSPNGTQIVSGSGDQSVRVWELSRGEEVKIFKGHTEPVLSVAFSPDGTLVITGSGDKSVRVWDLSSGEEVKTFQGHIDEVCSVAFSPTGTQVVSSSFDRSVRVWDLLTGKEVNIFEGHTQAVWSAVFSRDGTQVISGSGDQSVRVWDLSSREVVRTFNGHTSIVFSVAFAPDGTQVASGSWDKSVRVWDLSTGEEVKTFKGHTEPVSSVAFSPDNTQVVSGSQDNSVRVWDLLRVEEVKTFEGPTAGVIPTVPSPDATKVVSSSSVRAWELSSMEEVKTFQGHSNEVTSVAFSPDGTKIVSGSADQFVHVWELSSREVIKTFNGHTDVVLSVAFSPNGNQIVSGSRSVHVWDLSTGEEVRTFNGHTKQVMSVAFSPDGTKVASGSVDKSIRVWDLLRWEEMKTFEGHTDLVLSVAFSPDGTRIFSGSMDQSIRIWDLSTGEEVMTFEGHSGWVTSVAASPVSTKIISGSTDCSIRLWDYSVEHTQPRYIQHKSPEGHKTGWLLSPSNSSAYLMFVPLAANLTDDSNILTIPSTIVPKLNLSVAKLGDRWAECYTPKSL